MKKREEEDEWRKRERRSPSPTSSRRRGVFPWEFACVALSCLSHHSIISSLHPNILMHNELHILVAVSASNIAFKADLFRTLA